MTAKVSILLSPGHWAQAPVARIELLRNAGILLAARKRRISRELNAGYARAVGLDWIGVSVPLVRQHRQRVELDAFLVQRLGVVRGGFAVDRAVLDLAVVHLAGLFGELLANVVGVRRQVLAQLLELGAELALLL